MKDDPTKNDYQRPEINILDVEMEDSISAASATIVPTNTSSQVQEDWNTGTDETNNVPW